MLQTKKKVNKYYAECYGQEEKKSRGKKLKTDSEKKRIVNFQQIFKIEKNVKLN